jgi:hypothetical protein
MRFRFRSLRAAFAVVASALLLAAVPAHAQELQQVLDQAAGALHRGDAGALARLAAGSGMSVDVDGRAVGPLARRQAAAVIRRLFEDRESVGARTTMSRVVGGDPPRAFGEISWTMRVRGTTIPVRSNVFVALVREGDRWRITEIRLLR